MDDESAPDYRATLSRGDLVVVPWHEWYVDAYGPCNQLLPRRIPVSDLTIVRRPPDQRELIINELNCQGDKVLRSALVDWATSLDYGRLWFPDGVVQLKRDGAFRGAVAATRCRVCRTEWSDREPRFWADAYNDGVFPIWCPCCGSALPQWRVEVEDFGFGDPGYCPGSAELEAVEASQTRSMADVGRAASGDG